MNGTDYSDIQQFMAYMVATARAVRKGRANSPQAAPVWQVSPHDHFVQFVLRYPKGIPSNDRVTPQRTIDFAWKVYTDLVPFRASESRTLTNDALRRLREALSATMGKTAAPSKNAAAAAPSQRASGGRQSSQAVSKAGNASTRSQRRADRIEDRAESAATVARAREAADQTRAAAGAPARGRGGGFNWGDVARAAGNIAEVVGGGGRNRSSGGSSSTPTAPASSGMPPWLVPVGIAAVGLAVVVASSSKGSSGSTPGGGATAAAGAGSSGAS